MSKLNSLTAITLYGNDGEPSTTFTLQETSPANPTNPLTTIILYDSGGQPSSTITLEELSTVTSAQLTTPPNTTTTPTASSSISGTTTVIAQSTKDSNSSSSDKFSAGTLAGAVVGAAVGAALLAFLAAFLLFRPRRPSNSGAACIEESAPTNPWEAYLPQSSDDTTIRQTVESLYTQIDLHVENYYGLIGSNAGIHSELLAKVNSGKLPASNESLLLSTSTPLPIIKHSIAWVILSRLSPTHDGESCLLPPEFTRSPPGFTVSNHSKAAKDDQTTSQAYTYWRVLTAHLMYPRSSKRALSVGQSGKETVETLTTAFAPWIKPQDNVAARKHLLNVVRSASETGLLLQSQPSSFAFEWDAAAEKPGSNVMVFPALDKVTDERGNKLRVRQVLMKPKFEYILM